MGEKPCYRPWQFLNSRYGGVGWCDTDGVIGFLHRGCLSRDLHGLLVEVAQLVGLMCKVCCFC